MRDIEWLMLWRIALLSLFPKQRAFARSALAEWLLFTAFDILPDGSPEKLKLAAALPSVIPLEPSDGRSV